MTSMSDEKDDLKSIKVYKFDNTKEKWHEFALKFRVIADTRGYRGIIDGTVIPPDEMAVITITAEDTGEELEERKNLLKARKANKVGYRDLVMSTEGISFTIVQNAASEELPSGDLKKAWERLERRWNPKTREDKVEVYTKFLNYKLENTRQRPMDWIAFMEKKRAELMNTGHIMSDETFITHLLNSLPQTVYEGAILVIKDKLRRSILEITLICQKSSAIIVENLGILQETARKHAITLILLKKVSKITSRNPCWIWTVLAYARNARWSVQNHSTKTRVKTK